MSRNMSFMLTTEQMYAGTKCVTRRLGWWGLKQGDIVNAVEKGMGLKKGEKVKIIRQIRVVSARPQRLDRITTDDCAREGFPDLTPDAFITMFCKHNRCGPGTEVNRIEFELLPIRARRVGG